MAADKIGILGRSVDGTVGTKTVYTCPAGRGAKVRIMFFAKNTSGGNATLKGTVVGADVFLTGNIADANWVWSPNDATGIMNSGTSATAPTGVSAAQTVAPAKPVYYLSAGDTITCTIGTNAFSIFTFQVVGVETDSA